MNCRNHFLSACLILSQLPFAAYAETGFLRPDDPTLPQAVVDASLSVYKVISQGGRFNRTVHTNNLEQINGAQTEFSAEDKWWQKRQLQYCLRNAEVACPIFDQMGEGSAFLLNQKTQLYSNHHTFTEVLSALAKEAGQIDRASLKQHLIGLHLFFELIDDTTPAFDSNKNNASLAFFNPDGGLLTGDIKVMNTPLGRLSDVVRIDLDYEMGTPLRFSKVPPKIGETIYLIGYPMETTDRKLVGATDSDGNSLRISRGKVIGLDDWKQRTGNNVDSSTEGLFKQRMIFVDADCEHGNSGGPLVNAQGEVVGVFMALYKDLTKLPQGRVCGALNTVDENTLESLWETLSK